MVQQILFSLVFRNQTNLHQRLPAIVLLLPLVNRTAGSVCCVWNNTQPRRTGDHTAGLFITDPSDYIYEIQLLWHRQMDLLSVGTLVIC